MLNGESGKMGIGDEIRYGLGILEQVTKDSSMAIGRQGNPHRRKCEPFPNLCPCGSDAEGAIKGFGIGADPDKCKEAGPRPANLLPTIQLIFQSSTGRLMAGIIFDGCVE